MRQLGKTLFFILLLNFVYSISIGQNVQYINGQWFNGITFTKQVWYSIDGLLTQSKPVKIDQTIDLNNGYVIPPFGEAHNNNNVSVENPRFAETSKEYLKTGIFYVKNPNSLREDKATLIEKKLINQPQTIDAIFAVGGLTATGGHPGLFFSNSPAKGESNFYHFINSAEDIESKWEEIIKNNPDFIKTFLLFSEEFDLRNGKKEFVGSTGLNPSLLPLIVKKAHANGYRVSTHIETGNDFHVAVISGVDEIAHMPGFRGDPKLGMKVPPRFEERFSISKEDAELAAKRKVVVTTTIGDIASMPWIFELRRKAD